MESRKMFVLAWLLIIPAAAWGVKTAAELSNVDVAELAQEQVQHEKRVQALQQITGTEASQSDTDKTDAPVAAQVVSVDRDVTAAVEEKQLVRKRSAKPRAGEDTFAKKLHGKGGKEDEAQVLLAAVDRGEAEVSELATFVRANPGYRGARITLARMQILANEPEKALQTLAPLTQAIHESQHPDWQPWFWQGTAYLRQGELEKARRNLEVALSKARENANVWVQLAVVEQEFENHAGALQYLAIAEQLDPALGEVYLNRAYSLERMGRVEPAARAYRSFLLAESHSSSGPTRAQVARRISTLASAGPNN